jgi:hypothetical protein
VLLVLSGRRSCLDRALLSAAHGPALRPDQRSGSPDRCSDVAAVQVAVAVSHVLLRFGIFPHAADEISAREILLGVTEIFPRHTEVLGGFTEVVLAVAAMVMMAMVTVVTMVTMVIVVTMVVVVVVLIEQIVQETSDETSPKTWQQTEHSAFSIVARVSRACLMPTL